MQVQVLPGSPYFIDSLVISKNIFGSYLARFIRNSTHELPFTSTLDFLVTIVLRQKATAIIAYDHFIAMKILHDARNLNIEIPRQISVICFNDEAICDLVFPPLTTVGVPSAKMGQVAAELLLKKIESPREKSQPKCIKLQEDLVVRSSTAVPSNQI